MSFVNGMIAGSAFIIALEAIFFLVLFTSIDNTLQDISQTLEDMHKKDGENE